MMYSEKEILSKIAIFKNMIINKIANLKLLLLVTVLMGAIGCKTAKEGTMTQKGTQAVAAQKNYDLENALLWKIEGKGLTSPSYLFGTIHLIDSESFFWPTGTLAAFDESEKVSFEVDLDNMFDMGKAMGMMSKAFMADGQTLKDIYSPEDYKFVADHFSDMGLPMMMLERIKPMFLTVFASGDVELGKGLGDQTGSKSYEMELYDLAQASQKDVSGLETIDYQMSIFDSIPIPAQADMLLESLKSTDEDNDMFKEMVTMYQNQNINKMVSFMSEEEGGISGFEDMMLYTRNKNWIPVMEGKMKEAKHFFAVGAGHLGGKDGVIDLLKAAGYKLTPMSQK